MKQENILNLINNSSFVYKDELFKFLELYFYQINYLNNQSCSEEEIFIIEKLNTWLKEEGYQFLEKSIICLNTSNKEKVNAFINLYTLLIRESTNNVAKIIDLAFSIPEQFYNTFYKK